MELAEQYMNQCVFDFNSNLGYSAFLERLNVALRNVFPDVSEFIIFNKTLAPSISLDVEANARFLMGKSVPGYSGFSGTVHLYKKKQMVLVEMNRHATPDYPKPHHYEVSWYPNTEKNKNLVVDLYSKYIDSLD